VARTSSTEASGGGGGGEVTSPAAAIEESAAAVAKRVQRASVADSFACSTMEQPATWTVALNWTTWHLALKWARGGDEDWRRNYRVITTKTPTAGIGNCSTFY